ncbi:NAD(P)/FAD-dependent oxidoreductase [Nodosilinea nodulosa]|uniref:NAD(P)/FAD-dependent oxidoreductase n=1 Tax=Nodosilinea nodulosa TaxID=416001 RepID=UPI0003698E4B|nr:FAD-dependent monooxygenase [Nodosilinea nodulosa]
MSHAVVIGGSIAGLLAARAMLNHFDQVTLLERDCFHDGPSPRPGIPQAQHVHALLMRGHQILESFFPGLTEDLSEQGALLLDWTADWRFLTLWDWMPRHVSNLKSLICSRLLLEWYLRDRLLQMPGFNVQEAATVTGLTATDDATRITGVVLAINGEPGTLPADWIVDASGRNSKLSDWLVKLGFQRPPEITVNSFIGYASRWYQRPSEGAIEGVIVAAKPGVTRRGGVLYPVEGDRCVITLSGIEKDYPSSDEEEFLSFAQSLRDPSIANAIRGWEPISPIQCYRRTENHWRHFEKLSTLPEGIVAVGDAVCAFNPIYGQGMTAAALGASLLDSSMQHPQRQGLGLRFQKQLAQELMSPWLMATSEDFRWEMTTGDRPGWLSQQLQRYFDRVAQAANHDPSVHRAFIEVAHLAKPPTHLLRPRTAWKAITLPSTATP